MSAFDCNKVLPNDMIVKSIDDFLYEIGLCHQSVNDRTKRSKINSPKLISTVLSFQWIVSMASLFTNDETLLILLTDVGHFQGIKVNAAIAFMLLLSMGIFNQLVYYMNYKRGIEPTFLRLFQVMSGSLRPSGVGLTEESQWRSLLKIAKWLRPLHLNNMTFIPIFCILYILIIYLPLFGWKGTIIYGSLTLIMKPLFVYYVVDMITSLVLYFIIICKYILFKLNNLNSQLKHNTQSKSNNNNRIRNILHSYDSLYREIGEYNTTYWSQFLFSVWLFFGAYNILGLHITFLPHIPLVMRILLAYVIIILIILYLTIMTIASSLNLEANKSYKIMNSFIVKYHKNSKLGYRSYLINKLKVRIKNKFNFKLNK